MKRLISSPDLTGRVLYFTASVLWLCFPASAWEVFSPQEQTLEQIALLKTIREKVRGNESLFQLIKMDWSVEKETMSQPVRSSRVRGPQYTSHKGTWAQDVILQHCDYSSFAEDEFVKGYITVSDGEVQRNGRKPDLMSGTISPVEKFYWSRAPMTYLGIRLFNLRHRTTDVLVPEHAWIENETQEHKGRAVYVINAVEPGKAKLLAKIYIDSDRNMPVNIKYYDKHPLTGKDRLICEVKDIELFHLPNGGWFPIAGSRCIYLDDSQERYDANHIRVDTSSLTIRREDIPDELFKLKFPEGAKVFNEILGVMTVIGKEGGTTAVVDSIIDETLNQLEEEDRSEKEIDEQSRDPNETVGLFEKPSPSDSSVSIKNNEENSVYVESLGVPTKKNIGLSRVTLSVLLVASAFLTGFAVLTIYVVLKKIGIRGEHNG